MSQSDIYPEKTGLFIRRRLTGILAVITTATLVIGLFFTITNLVPLSVLPFAWLALLMPLTLLSLTNLPKVTVWASLYLAISLISVIIYDKVAFINYNFYRYDGNFFITFLPLIVLPILPIIKINIDKLLKVFILITVAISFAPSVYQYLMTGYASGFFAATNAFGGFMMSIIAYAFSWLLISKKKIIPFALLLISVGMLILSSSRGSALGIFAGVVCFLAIQRDYKWIPVALILGIILIQSLILSVTYPLYTNNMEDSYLIALDSADSIKESNVYIRAYENWPRGLYLFVSSPIFGTGVGSANDIPLVIPDDSFFQMNLNTERTYNSAHAHHTYLHILGEQGIVGLFFFLMMWTSIYKSIAKRRDQFLVRNGLMITFWALTFASFTEHRIPSPSNAFPFILMYLLYYMSNPVNFKNSYR